MLKLISAYLIIGAIIALLLKILIPKDLEDSRNDVFKQYDLTHPILVYYGVIVLLWPVIVYKFIKGLIGSFKND